MSNNPNLPGRIRKIETNLSEISGILNAAKRSANAVPPPIRIPKPANNNSTNTGNGRKGTRHYANGRNEPWWNTNETKRPLPNGWKRSVSKKVNPGQSFYFKNNGETSWNNPLNGQPTLVNKPHPVPANGEITPSAAPANAGNGRKGTRHYANGRNEPWWNTNEAKRPLPNGWKRSVSKKVNKGKSFYFKNTGETTWNNPITEQVHLVNKPHPVSASGEISPSLPEAAVGGYRAATPASYRSLRQATGGYLMRRNKRATRKVSRW